MGEGLGRKATDEVVFGAQRVPVLGTYDTVIVGGGTAGASAAISAARGGNRTLVVEKASMLGGTPVRALVTPMMPSWVPTHEENFRAIEARLREKGLETRGDEGLMGYVWFTPEAMAETLDELLAEAGGLALFDATLAGVVMDGDGALDAVVLACVERLVAVRAVQFVDATGDASLSRMAGVPASAGDDEGNNQMSSLRFEMGGIDVEAYRAYCLSLHDDFSPLKSGFFWESAMVAGKGFKLEPKFREGVERGLLQEDDLVYYQCFSLPGEPGCMAFNCPHLPGLRRNTSAMARSEALAEGRRKARRYVNFLRACMPGFEHAFLIRQATMLGVRESWRIQGKYTFTQDDYLARSRFDDAVAKGDWYIDVHSATKGLVHMDKFERGEYYEIPYRCLVNDVVPNMLTVGRCISVNFLAQASVRIQPTLIDMGDSAGKACARALAADVELADFDGRGLTTR